MSGPAENGVVIAHAYRWPDAQMAVASLRAAGIDCQLLDTNTHNTMPQAGFALGGMRLVVPKAQTDEAITLLSSGFMPKRHSWPMLVLLCLIFLWVHVPPVPGGVYLRHRIASATATRVD